MTLAKSINDLIAEHGIAPTDTPAPPPNIDLQWIETARIVVDPRYQRMISDKGRSKIAKIVRAFDWRRFGALVLAPTGDGNFAVIDGQHRAVAAGARHAPKVPAIVIDAALIAQAETFVGVNTDRSSVAAIDKFRARITAEDPDAVDVAHILSELGITYDVAPGGDLGPRQTRAVSALEKLVKRFGKGIPFAALEMLIDAQPDERNLLTKFAIEVTAVTLARVMDAKGDINRLQHTLEETDFDTLKENAAQMTKLQGGAQMPHGADLLLRAYNKNLQKRVA